MLAIILAAFFLFRSGFANYISGGYPISYPLSFNDMKKSTDLQERIDLMGVTIQELDFSSAKWLERKRKTIR